MKRFLLTAAISCLMLPMASFAAGTVAWDFTSVGSQGTNNNWDFGNFFTATQNITVTDLGYYDNGQLAGTGGHEVGIFDMSGNLLTSATISDGACVDSGNFCYTSAGANLTAGTQYQIVGVSYGENYSWNDIGFATDAAILYQGNTWQQNDGLGLTNAFMNFPVNDVSDGYWGPDFQFQATTTAPEPGTLGLLGLGMTAIAGLSRRRATKK